MFNLDCLCLAQRYSLTASGMRFRERDFCSRKAAEKAMYKLCKKFGLQIQEQYHDNHDRTYICNWGIRFYIQRA